MATRRRRNPQGDGEVSELVAYITSSTKMGPVYDAISKNYAARVLKGTYNHALAVKGWRNAVNRAAIAYAHEYGTSPKDFTSAYRQRAAEKLAKYWEDNTQVKVNPAPRQRNSIARGRISKAPSMRNGSPTYSKSTAMKEARALRAKGHTVKVWKRWEGNHEVYWVSVVAKRRAA